MKAQGQMARNVTVLASLTELILNIQGLVLLYIFVVGEEVFIDVAGTEEPDVTVVGDGAVGLIQLLQCGTLRLSLHGRYQERHAEETEQLLRGYATAQEAQRRNPETKCVYVPPHLG